MIKFGFSSSIPEPTNFTGDAFYKYYKGSQFLETPTNIDRILNQGFELRKALKKVPPGKYIVMEGMWLKKNYPLIIKKTGSNVPVKDLEFTQNRLTGLTAAFVYDNRQKFPKIQSEEAKVLGLTWNNEDSDTCKLYLSAVSGTEHFYEQFSFWPLLCALRKLQLKKIDENSVIKIAKKKNRNGDRMAFILKLNYEETKRLWKKFPGALKFETCIPTIASPQLRDIFFKD